VVAQELIPMGTEVQFSYAALSVDGAVRASVMGRENRQYPYQFGHFSTHVETVDEPQVEDFGRRMLEALRYTGIAEIEFKRDPRDGRFKLLDFNGRIWGWHTLAICAGVDFPYLLWRLAQGEDVPEMRGQVGVRWVRLLTDIPVGLREIRAGRMSLGQYLHSLRPPIAEAVFALDDPLPAVIDVPLSAWGIWKGW
jgi:predicted ATP-grasp superfamily ATP-dependent carboligase